MVKTITGYGIALLAAMSFLLLWSAGSAQAAVLFSSDFELEIEYGADFNDDALSGHTFSRSATGGLTNSGSVDLSTSTPSAFTTTDTFTLPTSEGDILTTSAYFKFDGVDECCNFGEMLLGFTVASSTSYSGTGTLATSSIGVVLYEQDLFQFRNNDTLWGWEMPALVVGEWYKIVFALESTGVEDTYNMHMQVWNSDEDGNVYSLRTWHDQPDVEYAAIADNLEAPGSVHAYFGAFSTGDYMNFTTMDDFEVSDTPFAPLWDGAGTEGDPYIVNSCAQLQAINNDPDTDTVRHFQIGSSDIDCSDTVNWNGGEGFMPIGFDSTWGDFDGVFDGNDKTISDLTINMDDDGYLGLFSQIDGATVRDLILEDVTVTGDDSIGALVGYAYDSLVQNVQVDGLTITGDRSVGGLAGYVEYSTLDRVGVSGIDVEGYYDIGGLAGEVEYSTTTRAYALGGDVTLLYSDDAGGLIGFMHDGLLENAYADVNVVGDTDSARLGGLVGGLDNSNEAIRNSFALGDVTATGSWNSVGGLVAASNGDDFVLENSFASGGTLTPGTSTFGFGALVSKWGESVEATNNYFYNVADVSCVDTSIAYTGVECIEVDSADYLKNIDNEPLASWDIALSSNGSYNINSGYPVLSWQVGASGSTWLAFSADVEEEPEPEEEPHRTSSSGGKPRTTTPAPVTTPTSAPSGDTSALMTQLRTLIAQYAALGGTITPELEAYLGTSAGTTQGTTDDVRDLEIGMEGEDVRMLQTLLMNQGYSIPPGATGYFSTYTYDALVAYQKANAITPAVGYFGPTTRAQMKGAGLGGLWW